MAIKTAAGRRDPKNWLAIGIVLDGDFATRLSTTGTKVWGAAGRARSASAPA